MSTEFELPKYLIRVIPGPEPKNNMQRRIAQIAMDHHLRTLLEGGIADYREEWDKFLAKTRSEHPRCSDEPVWWSDNGLSAMIGVHGGWRVQLVLMPIDYERPDFLPF